MKYRKILLCIVITMVFVLNINTRCFAATDIFRAFNSVDFNNSVGIETVSLATLSFQKLGYINEFGANKYTTTNSKSTVLNYISGTGNNYGFYVNSHGATNAIVLDKNDNQQIILYPEISGYWHLVFLDCCNSAINENFSNAFHTSGYSNRAFLGWYTTVTTYGSREWWGYFYNYVGTTGLRDACLLAADKCSNSTPIKMYGDKEWYGYAW